MSIEFHDEVSKLKSIIERYTEDQVTGIEYRVRENSNYERYVRVVFNLEDLVPEKALDVNFEAMASSIHRFLSNEFYTLSYVAPGKYTDYRHHKHGKFAQKTSISVKFFV